MRTTRSHQNIERAMDLFKLIRQMDRIQKKIKPLKAHFRPLLIAEQDLTLVAGRLTVYGTRHPRTKVDRDLLKDLVRAEDLGRLLQNYDEVVIDVKPTMSLAKSKEERAKSDGS